MLPNVVVRISGSLVVSYVTRGRRRRPLLVRWPDGVVDGASARQWDPRGSSRSNRGVAGLVGLEMTSQLSFARCRPKLERNIEEKQRYFTHELWTWTTDVKILVLQSPQVTWQFWQRKIQPHIFRPQILRFFFYSHEEDIKLPAIIYIFGHIFCAFRPHILCSSGSNHHVLELLTCPDRFSLAWALFRG